MIGGNDHAIGIGDPGRGELDGFEFPVIEFHRGDEGIVILDASALVEEELEDFQGRGLAQVGDVFFVADAEHENARVTQAFSPAVKRGLGLIDPELRHLGIHLGCQLDEAGVILKGFHFP